MDEVDENPWGFGYKLVTRKMVLSEGCGMTLALINKQPSAYPSLCTLDTALHEKRRCHLLR